MAETDVTLFTTLPNKTTTAHTIMINKLPPKKWQKQVTEKTFQEMYINVGMENCEKRPKQERDDIRFTHIAIPTSFYPSPTHGPTQYPLHADYLSIHHHSRITQQLHHMHKYNNSKSLFSHNCNVSIITKQQSKITKTPKQCFSQTTNCNIRAGLVITPHITCNRLLLSHLFPHNYNVSNMLHDALNRQKHLPLSTSFHASIMQHVHLELHYRHHPTQAFTGLPPRGSLLPTPIGSTHHLCMKLIHVPIEHTLQYYKKM